MKRFDPINPRFPHILHGGDYNPDQWLHDPEILREDFRLMEAARINSATLGVFSWTCYEPREGEYQFDWLDRTMDALAKRGMAAVLATPSGARPAWMSRKYPEISRVNQEGIRDFHRSRHNHCPTSSIYREKVAAINRKLAERYADHPALAVWHISNEYGGECFCDLCKAAFREWLKVRYQSIDALNRAWWTGFWSHTFTDWEEIKPLDASVNGMVLDWKRFVTDQTVDFLKAEISAIREFSRDVPTTTNFMGTYHMLDYWKLAECIDVISWDSYPTLHSHPARWKDDATVGFLHDMNRAMKNGKPFMLMESVSSATNWVPVPKLKRPGVFRLEMLQAIAHGSDTCQYFQFRKCQGGYEKFHGAVVDHVGHENTRVFRDVAEVGSILEKLNGVVGTTAVPEVALIHDWENRWALEASCGPRADKGYLPTCHAHYRPFWKMGVPVDVIQSNCDFTRYKLVIAPMLYCLKPGVAERLAAFVESGGVLVGTYLTGIVNESDLCYLGGWPGGGLRKVFGIWSEEIDALFDDDENEIAVSVSTQLGLSGSFSVKQYADLIHAESAEVLACYTKEFYRDRPAVTYNAFGRGAAYYIGARTEDDFLEAFYEAVTARHNIAPVLGETPLPEGVTVQRRIGDDEEFIFILNFFDCKRVLQLHSNHYVNALTGEHVDDGVRIPGFGTLILRRALS